MGCIQLNSNNKHNKNNNNNNNNNSFSKLIEVKENNIDIKKFIKDAFNQHNYYRKLFNSSLLTLNNDLIAYSQNFANEMSIKDDDSHSNCIWKDNLIIGESIFSSNKFFTGKEMTNFFYEEIKYYDFDKSICETKASRFTQMIWKKTKEVGFGIALNNKSGKYYAVANYFPPGNSLGEYKDNIEKKK